MKAKEVRRSEFQINSEFLSTLGSYSGECIDNTKLYVLDETSYERRELANNSEVCRAFSSGYCLDVLTKITNSTYIYFLISISTMTDDTNYAFGFLIVITILKCSTPGYPNIFKTGDYGYMIIGYDGNYRFFPERQPGSLLRTYSRESSSVYFDAISTMGARY